MKVAAIQMVSGTRIEDNLEVAHQLLGQAAAQGAELAVLPEYFCIMGRKDTDKLQFQETPGQGPLQDFLSRSARELGLWIVGGTLPMATADPARAQPVRFDLASRDGHTYTIGMSVCYDLRFPELYRALKADVLLVPSAFTYTTGQAHWEILLRARAIENQAYVLAAAQGGIHENGRHTWGHTMAVDPWGQILAAREEGAGVVMAEVQAANLQGVRDRLPALRHCVL
jgi:deaminated glutathione amidase